MTDNTAGAKAAQESADNASLTVRVGVLEKVVHDLAAQAVSRGSVAHDSRLHQWYEKAKAEFDAVVSELEGKL